MFLSGLFGTSFFILDAIVMFYITLVMRSGGTALPVEDVVRFTNASSDVRTRYHTNA